MMTAKRKKKGEDMRKIRLKNKVKNAILNLIKKTTVNIPT